ncbi:hypothetical protein C0Q70_01740 [Pomacea canaliculata]|uniref:Uncharacterized protein n=1 Tax=Pomacea canaliculata TaxID=400727 RepID=A0A2T7Q0B3_POMCA|nr:hypothetical protein C0Q70_01740 [Pomacea canaliculata]
MVLLLWWKVEQQTPQPRHFEDRQIANLTKFPRVVSRIAECSVGRPKRDKMFQPVATSSS